MSWEGLHVVHLEVNFLHFSVVLLSDVHLVVSTSLKVDCFVFVFCCLLSFKMIQLLTVNPCMVGLSCLKFVV
jgi:hypothetical protein